MLENYTTVQITKGVSNKLADLADHYRRSKAGQVEFMVSQEHRRVFGDGESAHAPTPEPVNPFVAEMD